MLRQTIQYTNFDDVNVTETLYFNLTKTKLLDHMYIQEEVQAVSRLFDEQRVLSEPEVRKVLDLVKKFMQLSYGERSEDGKRFIQTEQVWEEFTQTAAYDAFLLSLFTDPEKAFEFILGVMPADLRAAAEQQVASEQGQTAPVQTAPVAPEQPATSEVSLLPSSAPVLENDDSKIGISDEDLLKLKPQDMTHAQLVRAMQLKNKPNTP